MTSMNNSYGQTKRAYAVVRNTRVSMPLLLIGIALVILAITLPWWGESSWMREFVEISCYFIFAMMWNLMAGYGGMVSIGQQAFFGFGGYTMLVLGNFLGTDASGSNALGNSRSGVFISGVVSNTIGGTAAGARSAPMSARAQASHCSRRACRPTSPSSSSASTAASSTTWSRR